MDGPSPITFSRRQLLLGLSTVGAAGALTGVGLGTTGFLQDRTAFPDNRLRAGALDLRLVCDDDACTGGGGTNVLGIEFDFDTQTFYRSVTFDLRLPQYGGSGEGRDTLNNPGCPWLQLDCPVVVEGTGRDRDYWVLDAITAKLEYLADGYDVVVFDDRLSTLAFDESLLYGVSLTEFCNEAVTDGCVPCLDPGDSLTFRLTWQFDPELAPTDTVTLRAKYLFAATQVRHAEGVGDSPFDSASVEPCDYPERNPALSWIAFCGDDSLSPDDTTVETLAFDGDGAPTVVEWNSKKEIKAVMTKSGQLAEIYTPVDSAGYVFPYGGQLVEDFQNSDSRDPCGCCSGEKKPQGPPGEGEDGTESTDIIPGDTQLKYEWEGGAWIVE